MPIPALIAAAATLGGSLLTNRSNRNEAQRNRDFQERMSGTAHQRETQDLLKAGLNPWISAGGGGASTPSGSMSMAEDSISKGVSSAVGVRQAMQSMKLAKDKNEADVELARAMSLRERQQKELLISQRMTADQEREFRKVLQPYTARQADAEASLTEYLLPGARATAKYEGAAGAARPLLKDLLQFGGSLTGMRRDVFRPR